MTAYIARKLVRLVPVMFVVTLGTFFILELVPGDPATAALGEDASADDIARVRASLGLDEPLARRYVNWLGDAVQGDFGRSLLRPGVDVNDLVTQALPITLQLTVMGLAIALLVSIPAGVWSAYRQGSFGDRAIGAAGAALISMPSFLVSLLLAFFFVFHSGVPRTIAAIAGGVVTLVLIRSAWRQRWSRVGRGALVAALGVAGLTVVAVLFWPAFPRIGFVRLTSNEGLLENLRSAALPALAIAATEIAVFTRLLRSDMIATLQEDYVLAARAKGMPTGHILVREALRPSMFSLVTVAGVALGRLIGGTIIVETIFGIQGMGRLVVGGIVVKDFTIVQGGVLVIAAVYVIVNLLVDVSYAYLDPRIARGNR